VGGRIIHFEFWRVKALVTPVPQNLQVKKKIEKTPTSLSQNEI